MTYSISTLGKFPLDIQIRATDPAGPAFQAAFMINRNPFPFQTVNVSRAKIQASLTFALILADRSINDFKMTFLINLKPVQK